MKKILRKLCTLAIICTILALYYSLSGESKNALTPADATESSDAITIPSILEDDSLDAPAVKIALD